MNNRRSASVGALPVEKKHFVSRNESASGAVLDVRCACQYFQCESLIPDRINPVDSRPTSKQGFVSDMEHADHQHFDNTSTRSFNMMGGRHTEFDRISAASFGGRMHGMEGRGLVVRSISDATEQEMAGGMMAGRRGRQMSIGGMSGGGRDPDTVSIRSGISLRRISRSPSHADLFVADLNIPTPHVPGHSRRGSRGEIPRLNIVAPTPTPTPGGGNMSPPDFGMYERRAAPSGGTAFSQRNRWAEGNKENLSGYHEKLLPQNKPIDVSQYLERDEYGRTIDDAMDVDAATQPIVNIKDTIKIDRMSPPLQRNVPDLSPVVEDETRIEITDFAPQLELRTIDQILADEKLTEHFDSLDVPGSHSYGQASASSQSQLKRQHAQERDLSPDYSKKQFMQGASYIEPRFPQRGSSPSPAGMQYMETGDFRQRGSSPAPRGAQFGSMPNVKESFQRGRSPAPTSNYKNDRSQLLQRESSPRPMQGQDLDERRFTQYGPTSSGVQSFQRAPSPEPPKTHFTDTKQHLQRSPLSSSFQRGSSPMPGPHQADQKQFLQSSPQAFQRGSSPAPTGTHQKAENESKQFLQSGSQAFQRGSSPAPNGRQHMDARTETSQFLQIGSQALQRGSTPTRTDTNQFLQSGIQTFQRGSSPARNGRQQIDARTETSQFLQSGPQVFQRGSSPAPVGRQQLDARTETTQFLQSGPQTSQRGSSPAPVTMQHMDVKRTIIRGSSPSAQDRNHLNVNQPFQKAPSPATGRPFQHSSSPAPAFFKARKFFHKESTPAISVDKPHEEKKSYSARFMSMFRSKTPPPEPPTPMLETPLPDRRRMSVSHFLVFDGARSSSPTKQLKPEHSPTSSRLMSVFKRDHPHAMTAMSVVEGSHVINMTVRKPPEEKAHTVKVTETFSLKVDEMDQYTSRPQKSPSPVRQSHLYASAEHIGHAHDRISESMDFTTDPQEAFTPVVLSSNRSSQMQLQAGDRSHYTSSSQADLRRSREHIPITPRPIAFANNKKLFSVPIAVPSDFYDTEMTSSEFMHHEPEEHKSLSRLPRTNLVKSPSEQRLAQSKLVQRKFHTMDRTQSQDRAAADRASELDSLSISTRSMTKTVSFSFGEHGSRLGQHEKMVIPDSQLDNDQWLERTYFSRDHEYEPIGEPSIEIQSQPPAVPLVSALKKEASPAPSAQEAPKLEISQPPVEEAISDEASSPSKSDELKEIEELQKDIEDRYLSSAATTPRTESRTDYEIHTSQVDSSALEELPLKPENRKKGFMASAQDRTRKMQAGLKNQAGKIKTKFRSPRKVPSGSPKAKERKRFKAPEFSKIKMPEMKRPDLSGFKRPEFTKFSKPDMSKFKLPDKFSSLKLTRSKSFKEPSEMEDTTVSGTTPESTSPPAAAPAKKQRFDFSFGTYPRAFRKKNKPEVVESTVDEPSVILTTETQPSAESSSTPQGDRGPGPVRSRWADKFSDVSYNDSEGSRYRRYGSEIESSFDRESSMERRMKEVLDENAKEEAELAMLGVVEQKQFADYDEENRVIHEISKTREGEFKRRPMVHQDSDLVSEEGRDVGWTERDAERNRILRQAELEAEERLKYLSERSPEREETQSTASSKKFVFEEINDDEFLLRNKGISQEFNMINRNWLDADVDEDMEPAPSSNLKQIAMQRSSSNERMDFGYDVPPPKPRRLSQQQRRRHYDSENASQVDEYADDISLSQAGSDNYRHPAPSRPLRKGRSKTSQEISIGGTSSVQMNDKDWMDQDQDQRDLDQTLPQDDEDEKENIEQEWRNASPVRAPQAPRRRRKLQRDSVDKDSYANGFGGRSVSNSFLKEDNKPEEVIVYRTEHEYKIPLATPENYTDTSNTPRKSRSLSRLGADDDDRTSRGVDSLANAHLDEEELQEKYIIEMMENDGYAVVRKENLPKPTPPARRKKFSRSPGERFATMPHLRRGSPSVQEHKPASRDYSTIGRPTPPRRKSALSLGADSQKDLGIEEFTDYEIPDIDDRTESPRNLQSGAIINKMKYRPLPPPPRPPREKRQIQRDRHGDDDDEFESRDNRDDRDGGGERTVFDEYHEQSSDDYNLQNVEVEVSTQTDPLPDDFVCEEFEITDDMKVIEPRRTRTLDEILKDEEEADLQRAREIDEEVLLRGIQRFREANQRSASEKSRASSQAKSLSRPQTPSAILIEKRVPTPVPNSNGQTVLEASLVVQPIDDLDMEEELLRREGLYDGSHSKSDADSRYRDDEDAGHGSEEENARIGEEEHSYTRSTDAESQHKDDEEREEKLREQFLEEQRLQDERDEEIKHRLLRQLEEEERLLAEEEQALRLLEEEEENERRLQEEEEEKQKLRNELERKQRLRADITTEQPESNEDGKNERLKVDDSYELKSEISEERQISPAPSPPISPSPPAIEKVVSVSHEEKLQSQHAPLEQKSKDEPDEERQSPPPTAPPRKRSYGAGVLDDESLTLAEQQTPLDVEQLRGVLPSHLTLADLEVERLRVHALQAGQIMVSSLHGAQIHADELECRSGNLVVRNIELPPGFIEDIVERVRSTEREHSQAGTQTAAEVLTQTEGDFLPAPPIPRRQSDVPPVRPPPPQRESVFPPEYIPTAPTAPLLHSTEPSVLPRTAFPPDYLQSGPPIGFYNHRNSDNEGEPAPPVYRRRRHHRRRDSSSEDEHQSRRSRSARPEQQQQSVAQAGRQFISACSLPLANVINQLTNAVRPNNDNKQDQGQPRNISPVVVLFIVMTLGFLIYLLSGKNIHHHHWDYFNPPGNDGRLS